MLNFCAIVSGTAIMAIARRNFNLLTRCPVSLSNGDEYLGNEAAGQIWVTKVRH